MERRRSDRGAVLVEFAFVSVVFALLLTALISFGLILSFKQHLTQAAAEGARAGATESDPVDAAAAAQAATDNAVASFDQACGAGALSCTWVVEDCAENPPDGIDDPAVDNCITVSITYDYDADPLLPEFPILSALYPDSLTSSSTAETNP